MQSTLQTVLSAIDGFPWSLSVTVIVIAAMLIFREAMREIVSRSHELKAGRYFSLKAKPAGLDPAIAQLVRELTAAGQEQSDVEQKIRGYGLDIRKFPEWASIYELRLLANCVKR